MISYNVTRDLLHGALQVIAVMHSKDHETTSLEVPSLHDPLSLLSARLPIEDLVIK